MIKEHTRPPVSIDRAVTLVADGLTFPEAPRWHDGALYFSDFHGHNVYCLKAGVLSVLLEVAGKPSGLGWLPDGDLLVVSMNDKQVLRYDGEGTSLYADVSALAAGPLNDMVMTAEGRAYVGNFGFELGQPAQPTVLVQIDREGSVKPAATEMLFPNGSVLLKEESVLVVAETLGNRLTAFDVADDGTLSGRRMWADLGEVMPDGIACDHHGGIWVATVDCYVQRVVEGGGITHRIELSQQSFACVLDEAGDYLYVCTSAEIEAEACVDACSGRVEKIDIRGIEWENEGC